MNCSPPGSSVRDSSGENTGMDTHALLQGILLTQGANLLILHLLQKLACRFFTPTTSWEHRIPLNIFREKLKVPQMVQLLVNKLIYLFWMEGKSFMPIVSLGWCGWKAEKIFKKKVCFFPFMERNMLTEEIKTEKLLEQNKPQIPKSRVLCKPHQAVSV